MKRSSRFPGGTLQRVRWIASSTGAQRDVSPHALRARTLWGVNKWEQAAQEAGSHRQLLTRHDAEAAGLSRSTIARQVRGRAWAWRQPKVLALPGTPSDARVSLEAAVLSIGEPVYVTGWSLLWLVGLLPYAPTTVDVAVPYARNPSARKHVRVWRCKVLDEDVDAYDGFPVTSVALALLFIARASEKQFLRTLIIDARQRRLLTLVELRALCARACSAGGTRLLRELCDELDPDGSESALDYLVRQKLATTDLPEPDPHPVPIDVPGATVHVDIGWSRLLTGLDCHGFGSHAEREHLDKDSRRHNGVQATPWRILEATWGRVERAWPQLVDEIRATLAAQARLLGRD
jgi:hypothetical protein